MHESGAQSAVIIFAGFILLALVLVMRPGYLTDPEVLGALLVGQIVIASICRYRHSFFMVLMAAFFWAGMQLPLNEAWLEGRWVVLALGSLAGLAIYMKNRSHRFSTIHLFALFCVLSAVVSSSASGYPQEALLKSVSLFFLFLYGATGARLAYSANDGQSLFRRLLIAAEVAIYVSAISYFVVRFPLFGNPNSLGAVMGIIIVPVMFWGYLEAESIIRKRRLGFELCLAIALLLSSFSRAAIAAATISCFLLCLATRRYRSMIGGLAALLAISILVVTFVPPPMEDMDDTGSNSMASLFLYKGKQKEGLLGSRRGPWEATMVVIKNRPWFGSGFGTSATDLSASYFELTRSRFVESRMGREHGNSYLAIMEWSGLLGVLPFYSLVIITAWQAKKALVQLWRSGNLHSCAVPAALIIIAGLIGAIFEDWLFAVGYYVSVFFWSMAFILADLVQPALVADSHGHAAIITDGQFATSTAR
ncbi:MAG TPA: O-antigen ligase family protein [Terriglobales bacterium]|nr:O-antigen ligase family protein [Terriglobales bacterium]